MHSLIIPAEISCYTQSCAAAALATPPPLPDDRAGHWIRCLRDCRRLASIRRPARLELAYRAGHPTRAAVLPPGRSVLVPLRDGGLPGYVYRLVPCRPAGCSLCRSACVKFLDRPVSGRPQRDSAAQRPLRSRCFCCGIGFGRSGGQAAGQPALLEPQEESRVML